MAAADTKSQVETVFQALLVMIIDGTYPEKSRLPAERELCKQLATSRGTLREALRRLSDWGVVAARQGSGITVQAKSDWLFDVVPAYLQHQIATQPTAELIPLFKELMHAQRDIFIMALRIASRTANQNKLHMALARAHEAVSLKDDPVAFAEADFATISAVIASSDLLPLQWLMNRIRGVFAQIIADFSALASTPDGYIEFYETLVALMKQHDEDAVVAHATHYLTRIDDMILDALESLLAQAGPASPQPNNEDVSRKRHD